MKQKSKAATVVSIFLGIVIAGSALFLLQEDQRKEASNEIEEALSINSETAETIIKDAPQIGGDTGVIIRREENLAPAVFESAPQEDEVEVAKPSPEKEKSTPLLLRTEPGTVSPGAAAVLVGGGFVEEAYSVVVSSGVVIKNTSVYGPRQMTFFVPQSLSPGAYDIYIESETGVASNAIPLRVEPPGAPAKRPRIISVTPTEGGYGTELVITGENFAEKNLIYTGYSELEDVPSDGTTIRIKLTPPWRSSKPRGIRLPLWIYIFNEFGETDPFIFTYTI